MHNELELHIDEFQAIVQELKHYEDELSYAELYHTAAMIQKNYIDYKRLMLEEKKLEAFKQAHAIHANVPSALEAIAMCLGMGTSGTLSSRITDIVDAINKED